MAPTTRKKTPSTPAPSKSDGKPNLSSVVTPDKPNATKKALDSASVPKKNRKRNENDIPGDVEDRKVPAVLKKNVPTTPEHSKDVKKDGPPSPPAKKIKAKPRKNKHEKQEIEKFKQLYKAIEVSQPMVSTNQGTTAQHVNPFAQMNSYVPLARTSSAYTFGTFDGCVILSVYGYMTTTSPAYTANIKQQIENNEELKKSLHLLLTVNKRDDHNPFDYWKQQLPLRIQDEGRIRYKYWPLYVRFFENSENNTEKNRKKWAENFVVIANDLAPYNVDGTKVRYSSVRLEYQGDMGLTHLSKYLTVGDVFFEIERRWVNSQIRTPDERRDYQFTKILNNDDLLIVFFGDDQDFLKQVKKFYAETRHLVPTSIPQNMNDSSGGEDVTGNDDDSDDSNDESDNDGKEAPDDEEEQEEEGDENKEQESSNGGEEGKEEKKREAQGQQGSKKKEKDRKEGSTEQFVEEPPDKIQQHTMSEMFKSIDHGM
jgi:hypothetical protein